MHKPKSVNGFLDSMNGEITFGYLLVPYTPELNPIEIQWRGIKRALENQFFEDTDMLECSCTKQEISRL